MRTRATQKPKRNSKKCRALMKCFRTPRRKRDTTSLVKQVSVDRVVAEIHLVVLAVSATSLKRSLVEVLHLAAASGDQADHRVDKTLKQLPISPLKKRCLVARPR